MKLKFLSSLVLATFILASCDDTTNDLGTSLVHDMDNLEVTTDSFQVTSRTIEAGSVYSRSTIGYLGAIIDPETNDHIAANFMSQYHVMEDYSTTFPKEDSIASRINGEIIADSCEIRLFYSNIYGDSLAPMKLTVYEMDKPMLENQQYYSDFDPIANGYIREDGIRKEKVYSLVDLSVEQSTRYSSNYDNNIRVTLNEPYTDKDGKQYNNFGTYLLQSYYKNPQNFGNQLKFTKDVVPGFYFECTGGLGSMAYISVSNLIVYYRFTNNDSIYDGVTMFGGTEEVLQTTRIINNKDHMHTLAADNSCTYLKSPAGLFTEMTLPVDDILRGHTNDSINSAKLVIPRINNSVQSEYTLDTPSQILMIPKDSLHTFFENNQIVNYRTSYLASSPTSTGNNSYQFSNIANLISAMDKNRSSENWNKVVLIPVDVTTSSSDAIVKIVHSMSLSSTKLVGGSENPYEPIKISVIYSKFK